MNPSRCNVFHHRCLSIALSTALLIPLSFQTLQAETAKNPAPKKEEAAAVEYKASDVAAILNGEKITVGEVDKRIKSNPRFMLYRQMAGKNTALLNRIRRTALDSLIDRELLLQSIKDSGKTDEKQVDESIQKVVTQYGGKEKMSPYLKELDMTFDEFKKGIADDFRIEQYVTGTLSKKIDVSEKAMKAEFQSNAKFYQSPEQVHARHILIKVDQNAGEDAWKKAKEDIEKIRVEAVKEGADFAALAKEHSQGPSAPKGGDLGYFRKGQMVPPFEQAAFSQEPGTVSDLVKTRFGYHLIYVEDKKAAVQPSFEEAKKDIRARLVAVQKRNLLKEEMTELRKSAKIDIKINATPLNA